MSTKNNEGVIITGGLINTGNIAVGNNAKIVSGDNEKKSKPKSKLDIFLSYASEERNIAEQVYFTLTKLGYNVFFDKKSIPVASDFNSVILEKIKNCDLFIFLISPNSVNSGAYTLSELKFFQDVWASPEYRVLPVMALPTSFDAIPNYLKSVNILMIEGNLPAEVANAINHLSNKLTRTSSK